MVAGEDDHLRLAQRRGLRAQNLPQRERQAFQAAERAQGFGLVVNHMLRRLGNAASCRVQRMEVRKVMSW